MPPHKIRQEWLTLDEAAEVIRQHNITLLPADLIRHSLHGDLSLSVYFPSPVLLRPLNPPCRFACRFSKPPFPPSQCNKPGNRKVMANSPPCRRDPTLQLTTCHLWNLPLIGLERLLLHQQLAKTLNRPCPKDNPFSTSERRAAERAMRNLDPALCQQVLDDCLWRIAAHDIHRPLAYLLATLEKARRGEFNQLRRRRR